MEDIAAEVVGLLRAAAVAQAAQGRADLAEAHLTRASLLEAQAHRGFGRAADVAVSG